MTGSARNSVVMDNYVETGLVSCSETCLGPDVNGVRIRRHYLIIIGVGTCIGAVFGV